MVGSVHREKPLLPQGKRCCVHTKTTMRRGVTAGRSSLSERRSRLCGQRPLSNAAGLRKHTVDIKLV